MIIKHLSCVTKYDFKAGKISIILVIAGVKDSQQVLTLARIFLNSLFAKS